MPQCRHGFFRNLLAVSGLRGGNGQTLHSVSKMFAEPTTSTSKRAWLNTKTLVYTLYIIIKIMPKMTETFFSCKSLISDSRQRSLMTHICFLSGHTRRMHTGLVTVICWRSSSHVLSSRLSSGHAACQM